MQAYVFIGTGFSGEQWSPQAFHFLIYFFFADGRPAPLTKRQVERMEEKKQISVCFILFRSLFVAWLMYRMTIHSLTCISFFYFSRKEYTSCLVKLIMLKNVIEDLLKKNRLRNLSHWSQNPDINMIAECTNIYIYIYTLCSKLFAFL